MYLFTSYYPNLLAYAKSLTKDEHDAEDIVQDAAYKVKRHKIYEKPHEEQVKLFFTIVLRRFIDLDKTKKRRTRLFEANYQPVTIALPDVNGRIELKEAFEALEVINPNFKLTLLLREYGYSIAEIHQITGRPKNTLLSHLAWARRDLRKKISN